MVHNFKKYFVSVWPKLAEKIPDPSTAGALNETLISRNPYSMFLTAVVEREIWDIVSKCKNKRSTDCDGIDMTRIKKVIEEIIQPLTYICNLSFQVGTFPEKMKIA